ncbi:hypothetical protein QQS21_007616 [Conoideocrella luteorostrata]|uniref:Zn(2)-C6 fungal-type domain-containing protein n=1 Tax=Conoideocrella luteorostrata TaxID=1105319 RepID=A0AAJ0CKP7_9HYPO|nr:hypothetical protein QQS21_007616 [Conoideocrella luteorostrata]
MQTPNHELSIELASQACQSCRARKRKCDKTLPSCASCTKHDRTCEYLAPGTSGDLATSWDQAREWYATPPEEEQSEVQIVVDFPTIMFLDPGLLHHGQIDTPAPGLTIPRHVLHQLGNLDEMRHTAGRFFGHVHNWMPFISKKRFYDLYLQPSFHGRPDVVLLLLAIKLITTFPLPGSGSPRTSLYHAIKHFYLEAENAFSILVLQAALLISLYELGHGIYPAAYLSIGTCSRYAYALGINASRTVPTRKVLTLVEVEERRRVWWAIIILDRFVSIGCPGRPFATANPQLDDLLPVDDDSWDKGIVRSNDVSDLSSPMTGHMSKFALLCQAARLLGHVLHQFSNGSNIDDEVLAQLDRTLQSMLHAALDIDSPDYDQITFIYSALVALYTPWLSPPNQANELDGNRVQRAKAVLQQITERVNANLIERQCFMGRDPEDMSPWGLFFAYTICGAHMRSKRKAPHAVEVIKSLRDGLLAVDTRWKVGGVYLRLLEAQEAIYLGP